MEGRSRAGICLAQVGPDAKAPAQVPGVGGHRMGGLSCPCCSGPMPWPVPSSALAPVMEDRPGLRGCTWVPLVHSHRSAAPSSGSSRSSYR